MNTLKEYRWNPKPVKNRRKQYVAAHQHKSRVQFAPIAVGSIPRRATKAALSYSLTKSWHDSVTKVCNEHRHSWETDRAVETVVMVRGFITLSPNQQWSSNNLKSSEVVVRRYKSCYWYAIDRNPLDAAVYCHTILLTIAISIVCLVMFRFTAALMVRITTAEYSSS
jgi:hypothetical protein